MLGTKGFAEIKAGAIADDNENENVMGFAQRPIVEQCVLPNVVVKLG